VSLVPVQWGGSSTVSVTNLPPSLVDKITFAIKTPHPEQRDHVWMQLGIPNEFERKAKINIGYTAGVEADICTDVFRDGCNKMDAVFVPSNFVRDTFYRSGVTTKQHVIFESYDEESLSRSKPLEFELPTTFNFLTAGQWMPGIDRKGITLLINEFCEQFKDNEEVGLIVKTFCKNVSSADRYITEERLVNIKRGRKLPHVYLIHGDMSDEEMWGLYTSPNVHAFVLPTSGEGFGRMHMEAAVAGLPIITTRWSGMLDFLTPETATLLDFDLVPIPQTQYWPPIFVSGQRWARPNIDQLRYHMKRIVSRYSTYVEKAKRGVEFVKPRFTQKKFEEELLNMLDFYRSQLSDRTVITM
jgi:glycosyltransferase involved in cell wall biosynthesis